jgi:ribonucleoside-diphosphate reductase alpha chain
MKELPSLYQYFIHASRYSRWLPEEGRRESWEETVERYFRFFEEHLLENHKYKLTPELREELKNAVLNLEVMPSMRALMTAGEALKRENVAGYNCSYVAVNRLRAFDEILYVLMNGTGVGFSVEREFVNKLPTIAEEFSHSDTTIVVQDSKAGWARSFKELVSLLVGGQIPKWDLSKVRPAGARLKTFGGRASGPEPLDDLFRFTIETFRRAAGRKLTSIECHDIVCKIAEVVVVGGVRRSALISLSSLTDERLRDAKSGAWWEANPQRALSNNSVAYKEKPEIGTFMEEWISLYKSKSGERGIFNRSAAKKQCLRAAEFRGENSEYPRRDENQEYGVNPCGEILLRDRQYCNLSEVVIRAKDTLETLKEKVRRATIMGTFQSTLTDFKYISSEWAKNCQEERLLGVSLTGIMDNEVTSGRKGKDILISWLTELRKVAIETNAKISQKLKINSSVAITTGKPSGTVSALVNSASGIHARHNPYYVRTVRADRKDPLCKFMMDTKFPHEPCVMKPDHTIVFSFPMKSPDGAICRNDISAIQHLELWLVYREFWCDHNQSVTISVKENEWMSVGAWVYENFDKICGISFLPFSDHTYRQAPFQDCTKEEYESLCARMPSDIDWSGLANYEKEDNTLGSQELACSGSSCEIVDITNK